MTEDGISRRQVLRAASVAGGLGVASGAGASALLGDAESLDGSFGAGTLDLRVSEPVDLTGGDPEGWSPSFSDGIEGGTSVALSGGEGTPADDRVETSGDSKPSGVLGIAVTVCDNPGRVALTAHRNADHDVDHRMHPDDEGTDGDRSDDEETASDRRKPPNGRGNGNGGNDTNTSVQGGDGKSDRHGVPRSWKKPRLDIRAEVPDGPVIAEGSLSSVLASLEDGVALNTGCTYLGKIEASDDGSFSAEDGEDLGDDRFAFDDATVEITDREWKADDEVMGVDLAVEGAALCRVNVKGGGMPSGKDRSGGAGSAGGASDGVETYPVDCATDATVAAGENPGGQQSAISHLELYTCGEGPCVPCAPDDPLRLFLFWEGGIHEEQLTLEFDAEQCRHAGHGGNQ